MHPQLDLFGLSSNVRNARLKRAAEVPAHVHIPIYAPPADWESPHYLLFFQCSDFKQYRSHYTLYRWSAFTPTNGNNVITFAFISIIYARDPNIDNRFELTFNSLNCWAISSSVISYGRFDKYAMNGPLGGILLSSITKSHAARGAVGKLRLLIFLIAYSVR